MMRSSSSDCSLSARIGIAAGAFAAGGWAAAQFYNRLQRRRLLHPDSLPKAVDAPLKSMTLPEGRVQFYHRAGTGPPLVLLHSINAAGSTHEMAPLFDYFASVTKRPLYALDWLGFGQSDRPALPYHPSIYVRQLHRFLHKTVREPADLVALSLGCEYAASVAIARPDAVRRLVLIAPTGCSPDEGPSAIGQFSVRTADCANLFETFFYRLTRAPSLRRFYQKQVFTNKLPVPDALVRYAVAPTRIRGAHRAARYFVSGGLFMGNIARRAYRHLKQPTLIVIPEERDEQLVQSFEFLPQILADNSSALRSASAMGSPRAVL